MANPADELAPLNGADYPSVIAGSYLVIFKTELSSEDVVETMETMNRIFAEAGGDNKIKSNYSIGTFRGFCATMDAVVLQKVRTVKAVKYVECDQVTSVTD